MTESGQSILHASCVALGPVAALIRGASGSGKSALALELMAHGAMLVADDRTIVTARNGVLVARCPPAIRGRIEARGLGVLCAEFQESAIIRVVVDLDRDETERLPPMRTVDLLGATVPLLHRGVQSHFPAALLQYLRAGRHE